MAETDQAIQEIIQGLEKQDKQDQQDQQACNQMDQDKLGPGCSQNNQARKKGKKTPTKLK
jgi:hypothetical protein